MDRGRRVSGRDRDLNTCRSREARRGNGRHRVTTTGHISTRASVFRKKSRRDVVELRHRVLVVDVHSTAAEASKECHRRSLLLGGGTRINVGHRDLALLHLLPVAANRVSIYLAQKIIKVLTCP